MSDRDEPRTDSARSLRLADAVRPRAEERLRERRLQLALDEANEGFVTFDPDGLVIDWNRAVERMFGRTRDEMIGRSVLETVVSPERAEAVEAALSGFVETGRSDIVSTRLEDEARQRNGSRAPVEYTVWPVEVGGELQFNALVRDSAKRRRVEKERERVVEAQRRSAAVLAEENENLRRLDAMKDEFVSLVAHEVRTPLTSMCGYLELLLDGDAGPLTDDQLRFLGFVVEGAQRVLDLTDKLLFISRIDAGKLELSFDAADPCSLASAGVEALRPVANARDVELVLETEATPAVRANPDALRHALDNLIANGVKFTPAGGRVSVRVRADGDSVVLEVNDTGIGIPESDQPRLFERFFRASNALADATPGTGLGLAIVREIVDAHAGTIDVTSTLGNGTSFRITLPACTAESSVG